MSNYIQVLFFSLVGGVFSLAGGFLLLSRKNTANTLAQIATPFAAGALLAAAFVEMIPEALHEAEAKQTSLWILAGIVAFFMLEYFFHWFHHHHEHGGQGSPAPLVIIGDTLHNLLDGVAIGAAFLIDPSTGIIASVAIAAHEIPQEIGDFGLLLKFGFSRKKVLIINAISALAATFGALVTFALGHDRELPTGILLALTAGMFIYIAASDLIPLIHEDAKKKVGHTAAFLFIAGIVAIAATTTVAHRYIDHDHEHEAEHSLTESEAKHSDEAAADTHDEHAQDAADEHDHANE